MVDHLPMSGRGGKKDDTSCVVAEVVEWTEDLQKIWTPAAPVTCFFFMILHLLGDLGTICCVFWYFVRWLIVGIFLKLISMFDLFWTDFGHFEVFLFLFVGIDDSCHLL